MRGLTGRDQCVSVEQPRRQRQQRSVRAVVGIELADDGRDARRATQSEALQAGRRVSGELGRGQQQTLQQGRAEAPTSTAAQQNCKKLET